MLQLLAVESNSIRPCAAARFPFLIGRNRSSGLQLESPGVWETHARIEISEGQFVVRSEGESLLLVNDERCTERVLRIGDQLTLGAARVTVTLAPATQHALGVSELLIWTLVSAVAIAQVLLLLSVR